MKTSFAVLITIVALTTKSSQLDDAALQKRIFECAAESKLPEGLQKLQKKQLTKEIDNPKLKCFNACMMKKKGTMINGKVDPEMQLVAVQPDSYDVIKEVVNTCSDLANQQIDECEVSYSYVKCLIQNAGAY
ncbi:general odorant-binding protein 56d-like [Phymastichus coffea]|uniref:general odorant-binding protein 56d-like n=1 Tax=Phymastichus coffea TaxID=108790 RepID=UPI00273CC11F|nr:general odorant-binding protein 56d-like [Phymastichus coffea]